MVIISTILYDLKLRTYIVSACMLTVIMIMHFLHHNHCQVTIMYALLVHVPVYIHTV